VRLVKLLDNNHYYALKVIRKDQITQSKQVDHIKRERDILFKLSKSKPYYPGPKPSPFIVKLHETFQDDHSLYLLTEFLQGGELLTQIRNMNTI
jgi:serine/threonine protein kinase